MELELIEKSLQIEENQHAYNLEKEALNFKYDELNDINKKC